MVNFGDFCRKELGIQCQYGYYYFKGLCDFPELGKGLTLYNADTCYHSAEISTHDAIAFGLRFESYRNHTKNGLFSVTLCEKHNRFFENTCPDCRDESLTVQYSRGRSKLFKE